jgi:hypothetical protein
MEATTGTKTALERLRDLLGTRPHDAVASGLVFYELDDAAIQRELRLEEKGAERGAADPPPEQAAGLDDVEAEIISRIEREKHRSTDDFQHQLGLYHLRLVSLGADGVVHEVRAAANEATGGFRAEIQNRLNDLTLEREEVVLSRRHLQNFRENHGLQRPAQGPDSHILHFGIILLILLIESVLNGLFFARGNDYGLLGGASQALIIALLNVGLAFAVGRYLMPLANHRSVAVKAISAGGLSLYVVIAFRYNLAVAHFRDAMGASLDPGGFASVHDASPAQVAIQTLLSAPLAVTDFESWILFGVGLLFAGAAVLDGYRWDDPYPGYGGQARHSRRLHEDYVDKCSEAIDALREISDASSTALKDIQGAMWQRRREQDAIITNRTRLISQYRSHLDYLESVANKLLSVYRSARKRARGVAAGSGPSEQPWTMARPVIDMSEPALRQAERLDQQLPRIDEAVQVSIDAIRDEFLRSVEKIKKIEDLDAEVVRDGAPQN